MAVDTQNKRASCLTSALPFLGPLGADPDGSFIQADRQQMGWIYAGINVGSELPSSGGTKRRRITFSLYQYLSPPYTVELTLPIVSYEED